MMSLFLLLFRMQKKKINQLKAKIDEAIWIHGSQDFWVYRTHKHTILFTQNGFCLMLKIGAKGTTPHQNRLFVVVYCKKYVDFYCFEINCWSHHSN